MIRRAELFAALAVSVAVGSLGTTAVMLATEPPAPDVVTVLEPRPVVTVPVEQPIRFAAVGDSITAGLTGHMERATDPGTWAHWVAKSGSFEYVGGWAEAGSTSTYQAEHVYPVATADVLIILSGTNDFHTGIGVEQHIADLDRIAATVGAPRVVLLKLPPIDYIAQMGNPIVSERNVALEQAAAARGWGFFDPWAQFRTPDGTWTPGASADGIHPNRFQQFTAGTAIAEYLTTTEG